MRSILINILSGILIIGALVAAYQPALFQDFVYHDDVTYFYMTPTMPKGIGYDRSFAEGRFLGSNLYVLYGQLVEGVNDLKTIRRISAIQLMISCMLLFYVLNGWLNRPALSLPLAITIFTLPSFQVFATHAGMAFQSTGLLFSLIAGIFAGKIACEGPLWKRVFHFYPLLAYVFMCLALIVYPPTAMYFWVVAAVHFLKFDSRKVTAEYWQRAINFFVVGILSIISFAVTLRLVKDALIGNTQGKYNPYQVSLDIVGKIKWFFGEPLNNAVHLWDVFPSSDGVLKLFFLGFVIIVLWSAGQFVSNVMRHRMKWGQGIEPVVAFVGFCATVVLSFVPNLVAVVNFPFYRCLVALTSVVFLMMFYGAFRLLGVKKNKWALNLAVVCICIVCVFGIWKSNTMITKYRVVPSQTEFSYFKDRVMDNSNSGFRQLHVIQPVEKTMRARSDEFGMLTSRYTNDVIGLTTIVFKEKLKGIMNLEHVEFNGAKSEARYIFSNVENRDQKVAYSIRITTGTEKLPEQGTPQGLLVIDMTKLLDSNAALDYLSKANYAGKGI